MSDAVTVVWVGEADQHRDEAARALAEWARARGVSLVAPAAARASTPVDPTIAERVEKELAHAHEALAAADADLADRSLARAETILRAHPEASAAAWLRAEVLRTWSSRFRRLEPHDEARAEAAWQEAEALDGGRMPGIGEKSAPTRARVTLRITAPRAEVHVDGKVVGSSIDVLPGEHVVVALIDGEVAYASWLAVRGPLAVTLPVLDDACALPALATARREGDRIVAPKVACPSWLAAVPGPHRGSVLVARCAGAACASLVEWRVDHASLSAAPPQKRDRTQNPWPAWATWTMVGIGVATAASVVLVASGVFESRPIESQFVVGGARQE